MCDADDGWILTEKNTNTGTIGGGFPGQGAACFNA